MRNERKHYTAEEKIAILRRHLLDKVPISSLCEELGLQPTVFYRWQKELFENGAASFQGKQRPSRGGRLCNPDCSPSALSSQLLWPDVEELVSMAKPAEIDDNCLGRSKQAIAH